LVQEFAGLKFTAAAAHLMMMGVSIEHEHWLAECHRRTVIGQAKPESGQRIREKLVTAGYFPEALRPAK